MKYDYSKKRRRFPLKSRIFIVGLILVIVFITFLTAQIYNQDLSPVSPDDQQLVKVTIPSGYSDDQIAALLVSDHLIKQAWVFKVYVHTLNNEILQAGTYKLSPSYSLPKIVKTLVDGNIETKVLTILPGKTISQIEATFIKSGFSPSAVKAAFNPDLYTNIPIVNDKPSNVDTLEGLLWPDSFDINDTSTPETIVSESLTEMSQKITSQLQAIFASEKLSIYQAITLASIINQEVSSPRAQPQVAQVFLKRLSLNMPLGSDVTALYGSQKAGQGNNLNYNSNYNTLLHPGLPPTPIATISPQALNALAHPADTNWLYFVTGDNGHTYFATTLSGQNQNIAQYCHQRCS
jgi:UPF0755 protein